MTGRSASLHSPCQAAPRGDGQLPFQAGVRSLLESGEVPGLGVLVDDVEQNAAAFGLVCIGESRLELFQQMQYVGVCTIAISKPVDLGLSRANGASGVVEQLFVELLAGPLSDLDDLDVTLGIVLGTRSQAGKPNHVLGKVANENRLAHIEDKNLSAIS